MIDWKAHAVVFRINGTYTAELEDKTSDEFKALRSKLCSGVSGWISNDDATFK